MVNQRKDNLTTGGGRGLVNQREDTLTSWWGEGSGKSAKEQSRQLIWGRGLVNQRKDQGGRARTDFSLAWLEAA